MPQQTDRTIYVGSVGKEVDEPALLALFGHCGTVSQAGELRPSLANLCRAVFEQHLTICCRDCAQVTQIRIAGDPSYDTRYAFIEFTAPEEVRLISLTVLTVLSFQHHLCIQNACVLQAQVALLLDGMAVFDRTIKVSMARGGAGPGVVRSNDPDRVQRTVHVGGLPMEELSETVLADFFQNVGEVSAPYQLTADLALRECYLQLKRLKL